MSDVKTVRGFLTASVVLEGLVALWKYLIQLRLRFISVIVLRCSNDNGQHRSDQEKWQKYSRGEGCYFCG